MIDQTEINKTLGREILRKFIHLLALPILVIYSFVAGFYGTKLGILVLTMILLILLEIEYIRLEYKLKLPVVIDIMRRHEKDHVAGSIFFVASTIICFAAFDYQIALLAMLYTVFGDLMSALIGIKFGRNRIYKKKTLEGFLAGLITNLLVGSLLLPSAWPIYIPMALTASLVELWTGKLDDNLTVPVAAGFVGQILFLFWQSSMPVMSGPVLEWIRAVTRLG